MLTTPAPASTEAATRTKPIPTTPNREERRATGRSAEAARDRDRRQRRRRMLEEPAPDAESGIRNRGQRLDAEAPGGLVGDGHAASADCGDERGGEDGERAVRCAAYGPLRALRYERDEREQADSREDRAGDEEEPVPGVAPVEQEPADREDAVEDRSALRHVPDREHGRRERHCDAGARVDPRCSSGRDDDGGDERRRPEGQERRADERGQGGECDGEDAARVPPSRRDGLLVLRRTRLALGALPLLWGLQRIAQLGGEIGGARAAGRVEIQRGVDGGDETPREPAPLRGERRCALLDRACDLLDRHAPEGMPLAQRLPQEHSDRPDVALRRRLASVETLRRDVRERSRDVADGRERVRAVELGEAEVEEADREVVAILDEDVRGLDVAVDDSGPMGVRERIEDLCRDLDGVAVGRALRRESSRGAFARARTRMRCRRGSGRGRRRTPARSGRGAGGVPPWPRARRGQPPCPPAR